MATITSRPFGVTHTGENVTAYTLQSPGGLRVVVLDYGCILQSVVVPAKAGPVDVVLGHDTVHHYEDDPGTYCGAFVGRYANRIEQSAFTLNGVTYHLEPNNGPNHLHGCFSRKLYTAKAVGDSLLLEATSPDGEDGFPGSMKIAVRYTLLPDNALRMDYRVTCDADTILNLTNHSYFNLDGEGDCLNQKLRLYASNYLEARPDCCPTGRILPVKGTPMDFTKGKHIGRDLAAGCEQIAMVGNGYDHCYVLDRAAGSSQCIAAWAFSEKTGISMKVYTTQPGVQLYTGNYLHECPTPGKGGEPFRKYQGFALETQHFPCTPSHPEFPAVTLRAGKVFRASTTLRFFTGKQCGRL